MRCDSKNNTALVWETLKRVFVWASSRSGLYSKVLSLQKGKGILKRRKEELTAYAAVEHW